jgi:hypothetical protein
MYDSKILDALDGLESHQTEIKDRMLRLEQRGGLSPLEASTKGDSLGSQFVKALDQNRELFDKTRSVRLQLKATGDAVTTASGRTIVSGGVGAPGITMVGLQNALSQRPAAGTSAVEYSRFVSQQGAATVQSAEGALKAAMRPDHILVTQSALTVAGFTKMSRQALGDSAELKQAVDRTLTRSVNSALDVALTTGATGFVGGFSSLATAGTSVTYSSLVDAISEGVAQMQVQGFEPSVVAIGPNDWLGVTVMKDAQGAYLSGAYLGPMPSEMRGLRVVLSPSIAAGKALLIDSAHTELLIVDGFSVELGYENDDWTKNLVTVLGELRVIPIYRTVGSAKLITPKP